MSYVKVCGVTRPDDLEVVIAAGASAVGFNIWPGSPRHVDEDRARELCAQATGRIETVLVVVDHRAPEDVRAAVGADWVQLHGDEPPAALDSRSFKALGLGGPEDFGLARRYPGGRLLVDARDPVRRGGTGHRARWDLAAELAGERRLVLAGGLTPKNVAEAVRTVRPWGVDTASGVEIRPGVKDPEAVRAFVAGAMSAFDG